MKANDPDLARLKEYVDTAASRGDLRLPSEPRLVEALGVSRGRLRTLLKRLEDEGVIWRHVGKGTFVGPRQVSAADENWSASISVDDVFDARLLLEPQLAAQAAVHATPADLAAMDQCLAEMASAPSFLQWKRLDEKLHRMVAEAAHNGLLLLLYETLRSQVKLALDARIEEVFAVGPGPEHTDQEHRSFIDAIRRHNPERAEEAMREHLRSIRSLAFGAR